MEIDELMASLFDKIKVLNETTWDRKADHPKIDRWLENFVDDNERVHALFLLSQFMYFNSLQIRELLKSLYRDLYQYPIVEKIRKANNDTTDLKFIKTALDQFEGNTKFIGVGNPSESGTHLLYYFRQENKLSRKRFMNAFELFKRDSNGQETLSDPRIDHLVFLDDFCGSGKQASIYSKQIVDKVKSFNPKIKTSYLMLFATKAGQENVVASTNFDQVEALVELDTSFKCFSDQSRYFKNHSPIIDKAFAEQVFSQYGFKLWKSIYEQMRFVEPTLSTTANKHKLGYDDSQLLIGFAHNTPDNTLPIIWYDENHVSWNPIFKRYNKIYQ